MSRWNSMRSTRASYRVLINYTESSPDGYSVPYPLYNNGKEGVLNPCQFEQKLIISLIIIALLTNKVEFYVSALYLFFCQCTYSNL